MGAIEKFENLMKNVQESILKEAFKALQSFDEFKHETLRLEELYKSEKEKSINAEKKIAEFHEEI